MTNAPAAVLPHGVLAIRHGLTQWNADSRWQGWADVPLSPVGEQQARQAAVALAALLADRPRVGVVSSDLCRAATTADAIAEALGSPDDGAPIVRRADLRERDIGDWSGLTTVEIEARWPGWLDRWRNGELPRTPGGEHEDALRVRITGALEEIARKAAADDAVTVVVTHGGVIRTLDRCYGGDPVPVANVAGRWFHWRDDAIVLGDVVELLGHERTAPKGTSL
jgi:broad specificity phosphatase PhoE